MVLDPKIPCQISKNIDFRVSGVDGGTGGPVALFSYDKESPIFPTGCAVDVFHWNYVLLIGGGSYIAEAPHL